MDVGNAVLVVVEARSGQPRGVSEEAISAGRALADGGVLTALIIGDGAAAAASAIVGVDRALVADAAELAGYASGRWATAIDAAIAATGPRVVVLAGTTSGRDLGPLLAARHGTAALSDVTSVRWEGEDLVATRPVYQGKMLADVRAGGAGPLFVVTRGGSFPAAEGPTVAAEALSVQFGDADARIDVVGITEKPGGAVNLEAAETIVVGGRGVGSAENFALIEELATLFNAPVGATRAVTDLGWRPHFEQIGQTGKNVKPKLYIGAGVSGAVQHTVGMRNAETIVVINRDPDAPIFRLATIGIVGDLNEVIPALIREVQAARAG